jgi:Cu2+-exporting ATPase
MSSVMVENKTACCCCAKASVSQSQKAPASRACAHCGTMFTPKSEMQIYCGPGCERVAERIKSEGLGDFYKLKNRPLSPVSPAQFESRNWDWIQDMIRSAENGIEPGGAVSADFDVQGISCVGCVWMVEQIFKRQPGAVSLEINPALGSMRAHWRAGEWDGRAFAEALQKHGYLLGVPRRQKTKETSRALLTRVGVAGALAMNTMLFTIPFYFGMDAGSPYAGLFRLATVLLASGSFIVGGFYFIKRAWSALRIGAVHMDLPIALGLIVAFVGSLIGWLLGVERLMYFDFVSMFTFLMLLGRWVQESAVEHNRNRLLRMSHEPSQVTIINGGSERTARVEELKKGDVFLTKAGSAIPVSATLDSDAAVLSLEWINGESDFRNWKRGRRAPAGAVQLSQEPVRWVADESWENSLLAKLISKKTQTKRDFRVERLLKVYLVAVIIIALAGGLAWVVFSGDWVKAFQVMLSVLVVSCPCAMGVALPYAGELAVTRLRRWGVYVRIPDFWSRLRRVKTVVFDKTGTLTLSTRQLKEPEVLEKLSQVELSVLAALVDESLHPVSRSLRESLLVMHVEPRKSTSETGLVEELPGLGLRMWANGSLWSLGKPGWRGGFKDGCNVEVGGYSLDAEFCRDGEVLCEFNFTESLRSQAHELIDYLRGCGYRLRILSGDRPEKVHAVAQELGLRLNEYQAAMTPEGKASWIKENCPDEAMMIGDGINDSLAFNEAIVTGSAVADTSSLQEKSDFYFLGTNLLGLRELFEAAKVRRIAVKSAFMFAVFYNTISVGLSLVGYMSPLLAAVLMPLSSLVTLDLVLRSPRIVSHEIL